MAAVNEAVAVMSPVITRTRLTEVCTPTEHIVRGVEDLRVSSSSPHSVISKRTKKYTPARERTPVSKEQAQLMRQKWVENLKNKDNKQGERGSFINQPTEISLLVSKRPLTPILPATESGRPAIEASRALLFGASQQCSSLGASDLNRKALFQRMLKKSLGQPDLETDLIPALARSGSDPAESSLMSSFGLGHSFSAPSTPTGKRKQPVQPDSANGVLLPLDFDAIFEKHFSNTSTSAETEAVASPRVIKRRHDLEHYSWTEAAASTRITENFWQTVGDVDQPTTLDANDSDVTDFLAGVHFDDIGLSSEAAANFEQFVL